MACVAVFMRFPPHAKPDRLTCTKTRRDPTRDTSSFFLHRRHTVLSNDRLRLVRRLLVVGDILLPLYAVTVNEKRLLKESFMQQYLDILKRYWGYDGFRPLQADIIQSIMAGKDTLGLMPTGGGKSLTFQVPAMAMEGVCVVVTPLIALMKDQVENLKNRGIPAAAIYTGMSRQDILLTLDNCLCGAYKFLYVSPERLSTPVFMEKIKQAEVCLLAVDESHCISQWGYDFRPSYLRIADVRELLPDVPVLALTATATPEVVEDIQEKLLFKEKRVFRKSFQRENLTYVVRTTEDKEKQLLDILERVPGTSVVYVRNRKRTREIAELLLRNGISAEFFHAGLNDDVKDAVQRRWKTGETRVIVSTNAFGMGIDKPDVRTVIHMDLPDSLEAYFQEAGRAGRDELRAYAVLLYKGSDAAKLKKRIADAFPPKDMVLKVYEALGNYLQIGVGSGLDAVFAFEIGDFCTKFHLPLLQAYNALKILQQAGYLELTDEQDNASRVLFRVTKDELYDYRNSPQQERLIHLLLRSYTGLFTEPAYINEDILAGRLQWTRDEVYQQLVQLAREGIIQYIPRRKTPFLSLTREREETDRVVLGREVYEKRRERYERRIMHMLDYAQETHICRSRMLLAYFGEKDAKPCGVCDVCRRSRKGGADQADFTTLHALILQALSEKPLTMTGLVKSTGHREEELMQVVRFMLDNDAIWMDDALHFHLPEKPLDGPDKT